MKGQMTRARLPRISVTGEYRLPNEADETMELECAKFKDTMPADEAKCRHPADYCKFRSSCIIHFMEKEKATECSRGGNVIKEKKEA